jgi:hypothetical protein
MRNAGPRTRCKPQTTSFLKCARFAEVVAPNVDVASSRQEATSVSMTPKTYNNQRGFQMRRRRRRRHPTHTHCPCSTSQLVGGADSEPRKAICQTTRPDCHSGPGTKKSRELFERMPLATTKETDMVKSRACTLEKSTKRFRVAKLFKSARDSTRHHQQCTLQARMAVSNSLNTARMLKSPSKMSGERATPSQELRRKEKL